MAVMKTPDGKADMLNLDNGQGDQAGKVILFGQTVFNNFQNHKSVAAPLSLTMRELHLQGRTHENINVTFTASHQGLTKFRIFSHPILPG